MKKIKFNVSHFDGGTEKFKAGQLYDVTDETRLCVVRGAAVEVDVPDEAPEPPAAEAAPAEAAAAPAATPAEAPAPAPAAQVPKGKK